MVDESWKRSGCFGFWAQEWVDVNASAALVGAIYPWDNDLTKHRSLHIVVRYT